MSFDELQKDWHSPSNKLSSESERALVEIVSRQMTRRRRFEAFWIIHSFVWLTLISGLAGVLVATGKVDLAREWVLAPLLAIPWGFAIRMLLDFRRVGGQAGLADASMGDFLKTALASNQSAQTRVKLVGGLYGLMVPFLGIAIYQLHAAGKAARHEAMSMAVFFGGVFLIGGTLIALRFFKRLRPQQKELERLLESMQ